MGGGDGREVTAALAPLTVDPAADGMWSSHCTRSMRLPSHTAEEDQGGRSTRRLSVVMPQTKRAAHSSSATPLTPLDLCSTTTAAHSNLLEQSH